MASKMVLLENGSARPVDASALPALIEDAHDDAEALAALVEVALDIGGIDALHTTGAALARLRALESPRAAELSAQAGIALIAARDIDANAGLAGVPVRAPLWADMIAGASSFLPDASTSTKVPRVAIFAFSDESGSSPSASAGPPTHAGALTRAIPLAMAERLLAHADCLVTAPVVESKGFYVARRAWELPEVLALSPLTEADPGYVVMGRVRSVAPYTVDVDVWDLGAGVLRLRAGESGGESGDVHDVVVALTDSVAEAIAGRKRSAKKRLPPRAPRKVRDDLVPRRETREHLDALASLHAMLLAAGGIIDARDLMNVDAALQSMREIEERDKSLRAQLTFAAFIVASIAAGVKLDERTRNEARVITDRLRTSRSG